MNKKNIYIIIAVISTSIIIIGIILYYILSKESTPTLTTAQIKRKQICDELGNIGTNICSNIENFTSASTSANINITTRDQLLNIQSYYSSKEIIENADTIFYLPYLHFLRIIDLTKLSEFTPEINKSFTDFHIFLKKIMVKNNINIYINYIFNIFTVVNLHLYNKNNEDFDIILYFSKIGIVYQESFLLFNVDNMSVSFTKCLEDDNIFVYFYNISQNALNNINCEQINPSDFSTFSASINSKSSTIYKLSLMDYYNGFYSMPSIGDSILNYPKISAAYIDIIQFYIDNRSTIDTIVKNTTDFSLNENNINTIKTNIILIKNFIKKIEVYINAIKNTLPDYDKYKFRGHTTKSMDILKFTPEIKKFMDYINSI
jgi:hypothetical protein